MQAGTLRYHDTTFAGQAWWVPLQFGLVYAAGIPLFVLAGDPAPSRETKRLLAGEFVWATACYALTAFLDSFPWIVFALLAGAALARTRTLRTAAAANMVPALALVALGPLVESMLIAAGVFEYSTSQLGPIPAWLPLLYVNIVPFVVRAAEAAVTAFGVRRVATTA